MDITKLTEAQLSHAAFCGQITYAQWDEEEARRKGQQLVEWVTELSRRLMAHDQRALSWWSIDEPQLIWVSRGEFELGLQKEHVLAAPEVTWTEALAALTGERIHKS